MLSVSQETGQNPLYVSVRESLSMHKQARHKEGALQPPQSEKLGFFSFLFFSLFLLLELFAGHFNVKEGTSGLFLQICVHASKCVHLTHQGVCPIWSVLANFILLCLHGKRSKANVETSVMTCFAIKFV